MIFYQYLNLLKIEFTSGRYSTELKRLTDSAFHPEIFYPEIFISQGLILLILGSILFLILRWQVRYGIENKHIDNLSVGLTISILIFIMIFMFGLIIAYYFLGIYGIVSPLLGIITTLIIVCVSIYILFYVYKTKRSEKEQLFINNKPPNRLLSDDALDYRFILVFLFIIFFISPLPVFFEPNTTQVVYWEDGPSTEKVALPGMNISYNLIIESRHGPATFIFMIISRNKYISGNWSVSSKEVTVHPNERKIITFINYVPANASEGNYVYNFYLIYLTDHGPGGGNSKSIRTEVTYDTAYFNESQLVSDGSSRVVLADIAIGLGFFEVMIRLSGITLLALIVITFFFLWNKRKTRANKSISTSTKSD